MGLNQDEKAALLTEIQADPAGVGYVVQPVDLSTPELARSAAAQVAKKATLDNVEAIINQPAGVLVLRGPVSRTDLVVAAGDVSVLSGDALSFYSIMLSYADVGVFDLSIADHSTLVDQAFSGPTRADQNTAIKALEHRNDGSRAEAAIGRNVTRSELAELFYGEYR